MKHLAEQFKLPFMSTQRYQVDELAVQANRHMGEELLPMYHARNLEDRINKYRKALLQIAQYDKDSKHGAGICPYGCDCPNIAQNALKIT